MIRKSTLFMALGLALALGTSSIAFAGASQDASQAERTDATAAQFAEPEAHIRANVQPRRLPPRRFRNVRMFVEVWHDNRDPAQTGVPKPTQRVLVDFPRNVRVRTGVRPQCRANLEGTSTQEARRICGRAWIGQGRAEGKLRGPGGEVVHITDLVVSAFNGSDLDGSNRIRLHADSAGQLPPGAAAQVIQGRIVRAPGRPFGRRLIAIVPAIQGGEGANTLFNVGLFRNTGFVQARCQVRVLRWRARYFFRDGSSLPFVNSQHRCTRPG